MTNKQRERFNLLKAKLFVYRSIAQAMGNIARRKDINLKLKEELKKQENDYKGSCKKTVSEIKELKNVSTS